MSSAPLLHQLTTTTILFLQSVANELGLIYRNGEVEGGMKGEEKERKGEKKREEENMANLGWCCRRRSDKARRKT